MAYRDSTTASGYESAPSVAVPAGVATDDIVVLVASNDNSASSYTGIWPTGFTQLEDLNLTGDGQSVGLAWKRLTGADSGSYTLTSSVGLDWILQAFAFSGRHTTDPPTHSSATNNAANGSPVSVDASTVTAVAGDDLLWLSAPDVRGEEAATGHTAPTDYTEREDVENRWTNLAGATRENVSAGATGTVSGTLTLASYSAGWAAFLVRIPSGAAAPTISTAPITTYASGDYTDSGHTWGLTFTATDPDTTGADALTYYVRTSATFGAGTQVATGTCTSGASKVVTGLAYNASGLVAGPNTLYLHIYDGALNTVTASPLGLNVGAPVAVNVALFSPLMVSAGWFSELAANATAWFDREYFDAPSGTTLSPATASLTLSAFAPTVTVTTNYVATPAIATLALTGYAPSAIIGIVITPAPATLSLATFAPTVTLNTIVTPSTATLTLTGYAPALNLTLTPSTASLTLTTFAPSAVVNTTATPSTASLTLATFAPTVILGTVLTPSTASVVTATFAAVVTLNTIVTPAPASLTLTGLAPTLNETITPAAASLALTGFAPDVTVSGGAPVSVTPDTASLTLTGFAPTATVTANIIVTPTTATLTLATFAPSAAVTANVTVTPGTASLTLASFTPTATATANYTVTPTTASLTLSTFAPTAAIDTTLTPATATLVLAAFAPAITLNTIITPGTAALLLVAFAPLIPELAPVASPGDAIVSIPNWTVPYDLPPYMKVIHYAPARWKPPRYKKPW